jgi:peptide/nickel transport system substrate-binding protein
MQSILTTDPAERRRLAEALQQECVDTVPLVPCGVTLQPAAWRSNLSGVLPGVPKFWNVRRV